MSIKEKILEKLDSDITYYIGICEIDDLYGELANELADLRDWIKSLE